MTEDGKCLALKDDAYESRTSLGRKIRKIRNQYIEAGGKLYSQDELDFDRDA